MSALLELAEHYYAVARDMEGEARRALAIAEMLNLRADQLCERNMTEQGTADMTSAVQS